MYVLRLSFVYGFTVKCQQLTSYTYCMCVSHAWALNMTTWHITPLHWLPVRKRVDFRIAILVYRSLSGMAPAYLAANCQLSSEAGRRQLRSVNSRTSVVRRTYSNFGDLFFAAAGPIGCGTAFQLVLGKRTSAMNSLSCC